MRRLVTFAEHAARLNGQKFDHVADGLYEWEGPGEERLTFTTDRDKALEEEHLQLLGLEHSVVRDWIATCSSLPPRSRALAGRFDRDDRDGGILTAWETSVSGRGGKAARRVVWLGIGPDGERSAWLERLARDVLGFRAPAASGSMVKGALAGLLEGASSEILHRELVHSGVLSDGVSYSSRLLACFLITK